MIELLINNQRVMLDKAFSFKLLIDNPYFTRSGSYTRDIKLPMTSMVNRRVFGNISRADVRKQNIEYEVKLNIGNLLNLEGKAIIRNITEQDITIQCLFENSAFNFSNKVDNRYIDELNYPEMQFRWQGNFTPLTEDEIEEYMGAYPYTNWIWTPIYNESAEEIYNHVRISTKTGGLFYNPYSRSNPPLPYLAYVYERVLRNNGYYNIGTPLQEIFGSLFIVNANVTKNMNDILPHWTVNEFFTHIENFFGVVLVVENRAVRMVSADQFYEDIAKKTPLRAISKYVTEISQDEDEQDISLANIRYDLVNSTIDENREIKLDDFKGSIKKYASYAQMILDIDSLFASSKESVELWLYQAEGRYYLADLEDKKYKLIEVNRYAPLIRDPDNENYFELKIVPAAMGLFEVPAFGNNTSSPEWKTKCLMPISQGDIFVRGENNSKTVTARDILQNGRPKSFKKEVIEVAFNNMTYYSKDLEKIKGKDGKLFAYPTSFCDQTDGLPDFEFKKKFNRSLRLNGKGSQEQFYTRSLNIDRAIEYKFDFFAKDVKSIRDVFLIENNRYVAKTIEIQITQEGINPLQKGIFYLLED